ALERLGGLESRHVEALAKDADRAVRIHLMKVLAERSWEQAPIVSAALSDNNPFVRRAAADALARHPHSANVKPLLTLWTTTPAEDTHLIHVARMALRDQLLKDGIYEQLAELVGTDADTLDRLANVSLGVPNANAARYLWQQLQANPARTGRHAYWQH